MDVGLQMVFASYGWDGVSDEQVWDEELRLAAWPPISGFDVLWSVEHHFNDYSFCPDNLQLMSYLAGRLPGRRPRHRGRDPALARSAARRREGRRAGPTSARDGCVSAWAAASPGASSRRSGARWTSRGIGSMRRRR